MVPKFWILYIAVFCCLLKYAFSSYFDAYHDFEKTTSMVFMSNDSLFKPRSGEFVLPQEARAVLAAQDSLGFPDFRLVGKLLHNNAGAPEAFQRINESIWPIRSNTNSRYVIGFSEEIDTLQNLNIVYRNANISVGTLK